jgi:hypothetical protein
MESYLILSCVWVVKLVRWHASRNMTVLLAFIEFGSLKKGLIKKTGG